MQNSVIPPIITNQQDRYFLQQVTEYIQNEVEEIIQSDPQQRFTVYKTAFEKVCITLLFFLLRIILPLLWLN